MRSFLAPKPYDERVAFVSLSDYDRAAFRGAILSAFGTRTVLDQGQLLDDQLRGDLPKFMAISGGMPRIEALGNLCLTFAKSIRLGGLTRQSARSQTLLCDIVLGWTIVIPSRSQLSHDFWIWQSRSRVCMSFVHAGHRSVFAFSHMV